MKKLQLISDLWGWEPHESQKKLILSRAKTRVAACGRRWGKSEALAYDTAAEAILRPYSKQMIVAPTYDQSRIVYDLVCELLKSHDPKATSSVTPYPHMTIAKSHISARSADNYGKNLRGHSADRIIIDEAAFVRDSVITDVIAPMLADCGGELIMLSTPNGKNEFYRAYLRGIEGIGDTQSFHFPSSDNPYISAEYIENQRKIMSKAQFQSEYEAVFGEKTNAVFTDDEIRAASRLVLDFDGIHVCGIDWARYRDYTAIVTIKTTALK